MHDATEHEFNGPYADEHLSRVAFPLGGIGAGMVCVEGAGALSHVSLRHRPEVFHEPNMFAALHVKEAGAARVLEGPVPTWKVFGAPGAANGAAGKNYGLPRFRHAEFVARFPFAGVSLRDPALPVAVGLTAWSPFTPPDPDPSSLPVCALEYSLRNTAKTAVNAVLSFHAENFMRMGDDPVGYVEPTAGGFLLRQPPSAEEPWREGAFAAFTLDDAAHVDCGWFRGGWFDTLTMLWKDIASGRTPSRPPHPGGQPSRGASLYVPCRIEPGADHTVRILLAWYVPRSRLSIGGLDPSCCASNEPSGAEFHEPWYAGRFDGIEAVAAAWRADYETLRRTSALFRDCLYETSLPPEVVEAASANLSILKSPTCLRQKDGRFWAWEGCCDGNGCCHGSCTHVWNYAQAVCHLFPSLERTLRETEFLVSQDERGHQNFRSALPIAPTNHDFHAASDGQLGGIMKVYREWRVSGDTDWMRSLWPRVKQSLAYCIETWDPDREGVLTEPHHNTYDIEFWGPDGMCSSFYLGALRAAALMGGELGEDVSPYEDLYAKGRWFLEHELFNGEYVEQKVRWTDLHAPNPAETVAGKDPRESGLSPEALELLAAEGPKYQYGTGCLSDGILGAWIAEMCGLPPILEPDVMRAHLCAVHRHNLRHDLSDHANPQRPSFAVGAEGGLLLGSWPKGGEPALPCVYSNEVWTGIEYQVAGHLACLGETEKALELVRACRSRYDGRIRNPFNEYECGHWYARALASYGLLASMTGVRYDAVTKTLAIAPRIAGDFAVYLCTATGFGLAGMRNGEPFVDVRSGAIDVARIARG